MKKSINAKILCALVALMMVFSAFVFIGCNEPVPPETQSLSLPKITEGTDGYYINGKQVTTQCWKEFVSMNFSNSTYISEHNEIAGFKIDQTGDLFFIYSGYGHDLDTIKECKADFSDLDCSEYIPTCGKIIGVDNIINDGFSGYVLLLETSHHSNSIHPGYESYCYGNDSKLDNDHACFIPVYCNTFKNPMEQACFSKVFEDSKNYACFESLSDALQHMKYSSEIYAFTSKFVKK